MASLIYEYYEAGILIPEKTASGFKNYSYVCKLCKQLGRTKNEEEIRIKDGKSN